VHDASDVGEKLLTRTSATPSPGNRKDHPMKLCTFEPRGATQDRRRPRRGDRRLAAAGAPSLPREMCALLGAGRARAARRARTPRRARRAASRSTRCASPRRSCARPSSSRSAQLRRHIAEAKLETPKVPTVFNKQSTCVTGSARSDPPAARLVEARLRGRARLRDRPAAAGTCRARAPTR
jgi:hypothetical protein